MIIYVFKKHENLSKTMKIVEIFFIIKGKWSEPEPEFSTNWSRSRTKMDRLRNTAMNHDFSLAHQDFFFLNI
jgi:hypothetical protein